MRFSYVGRNTTVTDALKEKTEQKLRRLERLIPEDSDINVTFTFSKSQNKIEVTIPLRKRILRAEVTTDDMYASIDQVADVLEKQVTKYKQRLRDRSRRDGGFSEEYAFIAGDKPSNETEKSEIVIEKSKRFALKPMDAEEAVMEMELLGHCFYAFRNDKTDEINVVYKRNSGTYGLIEPEN